MGKPIPPHRRTAAERHLTQMGISNAEERFRCVSAAAEKLERDQPHAAIQQAMRCVDLTGAYRLVAVLLTSEESDEDEEP
jgi:hypothetical protein